MLIDFFKYDQCTDTLLMSASNSAPAEIIEFDVAGNLDSVTLLATVPMFDNVTNTAFELTVRRTDGEDCDGEFAMAEHIREILKQEQEHQIDLATALDQDPPNMSRPKY